MRLVAIVCKALMTAAMAAARVASDDHLPAFIDRAIATELRSPDTRAKLHALVHDELTKLIGELQSRLS